LYRILRAFIAGHPVTGKEKDAALSPIDRLGKTFTEATSSPELVCFPLRFFSVPKSRE
jgi:hypothetical protein